MVSKLPDQIQNDWNVWIGILARDDGQFTQDNIRQTPFSNRLPFTLTLVCCVSNDAFSLEAFHVASDFQHSPAHNIVNIKSPF